VIVAGGGATATSAVATVTVNAGPAPALQPYIGANFIGAAAGIGYSGILRSNDVAGVVPQANYNNLTGGTGANVVLNDANGAATPVSISYTAQTYVTGTGENTAENVLFQGYIHNVTNGFDVTLRNIPAGTYNFIAYGVGFNFNATYEERVQLTGSAASPIYRVRAEHAGTYNAAPSIFRRMSSTNAAARDEGNYIMFENVSPDASGTFTLTLTNESTFTGSNVSPPLSGLQLVRVNAVDPGLPTISFVRTGPFTPPRKGTNVTISWPLAVSGFTLQSKPSITNTTWTNVPGVVSNSITLSNQTGTGFFRLIRP
jgi:hypothetical protein